MCAKKSNFEPNKGHLRELLIYFSSCRESFQKFKNGEFDTEDKERNGRPKVYEDAELEALLNHDSCQMQEEECDGQYFE